MQNTIQAINALNNIKNTTKQTEKIEIIKSQKDNPAFLTFLNIGFSPFINTHLKKLPEYNPASFDKYIQPYTELKTFVDYANSINRSNNLLQKFYEFISSCGKEHKIYSALITKSLKIGISIKLINKAFGYFFIPDTNLMKAYDIHKLKKEEIKFPVFVEEKLDGVRCIVIKEDNKILAYTYNGSSLKLDYIFKEIEQLPDNVYDGELLAGIRQKTAGIVNQIINKNYKSEQELVFNIFDVIDIDDFTDKFPDIKLPLWQRKSEIYKIFNDKELKYIRIVPHFQAVTLNEVMDYFESIRAKGGEGVMIKNIYSLYQRKRSKNWVKIKGINSITMEVTNIELGEGKYKGQIGKLICQTNDEALVLKVGSGLTDNLRKEKLNFWIGKFIEVEYTDAYYLNNKLVVDFPRFKEIRCDKNKADNISVINIKKEK